LERTETIFTRLEAMVDTRRTKVVLVGYPFLSIDTNDYYLDFHTPNVRRTRYVLDGNYYPAAAVRGLGVMANDGQQNLVADWNRTHDLEVVYVDGVSDSLSVSLVKPYGDYSIFAWVWANDDPDNGPYVYVQLH
jgi:hypothetical protein